MADWYATQAGAGSADGTSLANAWALTGVDWTASGVQPGDTLNLDGTFTSPLITAGGGTVGAEVTFSGGTFERTSNSVDLRTEGYDYLIFDDISMTKQAGSTQRGLRIDATSTNTTIKDSTFDGNSIGTIGINYVADVGGLNDVIIDNVTMTGWTQECISHYQDTSDLVTDGLTLINSTINQSNVTSRAVELATDVLATNAGVQNVYIANNVITGGLQGIRWGGQAAVAHVNSVGTISNNTITGSGNDTNGGGIVIVADNAVISNNIISTIDGANGGINIIESSGCVVFDNAIEDVTLSTHTVDGGGILIAGADIKVHRNWMKGCVGSGGAVGADASGFDIRFGQQDSNAAMEAVGNVGIGARDSIQFAIGATASGEQVCANNSSVSVTEYGFRVFDAFDAASTARLYNTIFYGTGGSTRSGTVSATATGTFVEDYNCVFNFASSNLPIGHTLGGNTIIADPLFKDLANDDFRLNSDSPCLATGLEWWTGTPPTGFDGLRFMVPPSIGGFEIRTTSGYARSAGAIPTRVLPAGVDIAKAKAA